MEKQTRKLKSYFKTAVVLLSLFTLVFTGCKKEEQNSSQQIRINEAKEWLLKQKNGNRLSVDWTKAQVFSTEKRDIVSISLPSLEYDGKIITLNALLIYKNDDGNIIGNFLLYMPKDKAIPISTLINLIDKPETALNNLNGIAIQYSFDGKKLNQYGSNNKLSSLKSNLQASKTAIKTSKKIAVEFGSGVDFDYAITYPFPSGPSEPPAPGCTDYFLVTYTQYHIVEVLYIGRKCGFFNLLNLNGELFEGVRMVNGGGDSNQEALDTINHVNNDCIKNGLGIAMGANCINDIKNLMSSTFLGSESPDIDFYDSSMTPADSNTYATTYVNNQASLNITITFNTANLPNTSEEFIVSTVYHEILHAYLFQLFPPNSPNGTIIIPNQHEYIATNYINMMASSLKSMYPGISDPDAWALSWGGLEKTSAWDLLTAQQKAQVINTNRKYAGNDTSNKKGTYCN